MMQLPFSSVYLPKINKNLKMNYNIKCTSNINHILKFYSRMSRDSVEKKQIEEWFNKGHKCFLVYSLDGIPIGGMWVFEGNFHLKNLSVRTLSSQKEIQLDKNHLYGAYVIVDENYRGQGINQYLLSYVINYHVRFQMPY